MTALATCTITVNDTPRQVAAGTTVEQLAADLGLAGRKGVAIAISGSVVPRADWATRELAEGARVLVIRATQGG